MGLKTKLSGMSVIVVTAVFGVGVWLGVAVRSGGVGRFAQHSVVNTSAEVVGVALSGPIVQPALYVPPPWPARPVVTDSPQQVAARTPEGDRGTDRQVRQPENQPADRSGDETEDEAENTDEDKTEDEAEDKTGDEAEDKTGDEAEDKTGDEPTASNEIREQILDQLEEQPALEDMLKDLLEDAEIPVDDAPPYPAEAIEAEQLPPDGEVDANDAQDVDGVAE